MPTPNTGCFVSQTLNSPAGLELLEVEHGASVADGSFVGNAASAADGGDGVPRASAPRSCGAVRTCDAGNASTAAHSARAIGKMAVPFPNIALLASTHTLDPSTNLMQQFVDARLEHFPGWPKASKQDAGHSDAGALAGLGRVPTPRCRPTGYWCCESTVITDRGLETLCRAAAAWPPSTLAAASTSPRAPNTARTSSRANLEGASTS